MKIMRIYSSDLKFKEVSFNTNFNVVLGKLSDSSNLEIDSHNLGKSTLIELIDFLLLKELDKTHFLKNPIFNGYVFYMEILTNSKLYVTIKRGVDNNTKISISVQEQKGLDGIRYYEWEYENLPLNSKDLDNNPKVVLNNLLGFNVLEKYAYRKTSGYFLRTQEDYKDVFKLNKYRGRDVDWKPILFELLGFNSEHMINKYDIERAILEKNNLIDKVKDEFKVDEREKDKIRGLMEICEDKKNEVSDWLDDFDFYNKESGLNKEAIEEVETNISRLNTERYNLNFDIQQVEEALKVKVDYNLDDMLKTYEEVGIIFPNKLIKEYDELLQFNKKVSRERMKYLEITRKEKKERIKSVEEQLVKENELRKHLLSVLKTTNTFEKYNTYRSDLIKVERELERYLAELESIDLVNKIRNDISERENELKTESGLLAKQIDDSTSLYKKIRKDFHDYVSEVLNHKAMISLVINGNENIDFEATFYDEEEVETEQGNGHTYKKLLCACFDLAVIKNYMDKSFYRFIYHDGCLESLDPRKQKKFLKLVRRLSEEHGFQYILTSLSSDIPNEQEYRLTKQETAVVLSDASDDSGRLFGISF